MTHAFSSQRTFRPTHSLLGRALRRWTGDRLKGEAYFVLTLSGLTLALLMAHYLGWALLQPIFTGPDGTWYQTVFWIGQLGSTAALALIGLVGWRPALSVACDDAERRLRISQGERSCRIDYDDVEDVSLIPARQYQRHYRHYAATRIFIGRLTEKTLLLETDEGPVVLGLPPDDQAALHEHLTDAAPAAAAAPSTNGRSEAPVEAGSEAAS